MKDYLVHDISLTLRDGMVTYPKDVPYRRCLQRDLGKGDSSNVSVFETSAHAGTHVDAPLHYISSGYSVDKIPLNHLYGPAFVADCRNAAAVTADHLSKVVPDGVKRLLLKTDNSSAAVARRPDTSETLCRSCRILLASGFNSNWVIQTSEKAPVSSGMRVAR